MGEMCVVLLVWFVPLTSMRDASSLKEMGSKLSKTFKVIKETIVWENTLDMIHGFIIVILEMLKQRKCVEKLFLIAYGNFKGPWMAEICVPGRNWFWILGWELDRKRSRFTFWASQRGRKAGETYREKGKNQRKLKWELACVVH